ncbi:hypothetical protein BLNAU_8692 [Blattamonas nauphoetae]|uniref:Uncharacterized protein n=1 Tax=Blattamonas nauphoetae TaxID=2049346 RepID=A0ABQ9XXW1_9EUKA|nr:hypothetical protein BLNAU_8692 [Blattamonas nauphoetae]
MNSGGSVLCSNPTFSWCRTTSDERPSSSQLHPSTLLSNEHLINDTTFDGNKENDSDTRLNITTYPIFIKHTFQNMVSTTIESTDGGSALILTEASTHLAIQDCSFINCSVFIPQSNLQEMDWAAINMAAVLEHTTHPRLSPLCSNFTLSGAKRQTYNGGFINLHIFENTSSPVTISNYHLQGDGTSTGNCLDLRSCAFESGGLGISDTEIVNTNSLFKMYSVSGIKPIVVTRSSLVFGSLKIQSKVVTTHDPLLFVDCTLDEFRSEPTDRSNADILFIGCVFHTFPNSSSIQLLSAEKRFVIVQACLKADFRFFEASPSLLNTSSVIGCTSNRTIRVTTDGYHVTECPLFDVTLPPNPKSKIELEGDADENGNPIETMDTLWSAIQSLQTGSSTIISLSDGPFTETSPLPIQTDVEIVGNGTEFVHLTLEESPRAHTTKLKATLNVRAGANLTLRSITLIPTSSSSPFVVMNEEGNLTVGTVVVSAEQDRTTELFCKVSSSPTASHSKERVDSPPSQHDCDDSIILSNRLTFQLEFGKKDVEVRSNTY